MCVCVYVCVYIAVPVQEQWSNCPSLGGFDFRGYDKDAKQVYLMQMIITMKKYPVIFNTVHKVERKMYTL